ncbi:MAG: hypothetical protein HQ581_02515 [Planctomycetes bacterium]|nr:hypothetical protein [Planctomycetota bacterium]
MKVDLRCPEAVPRAAWSGGCAALLTVVLGYACPPVVAQERVPDPPTSPPRVTAMPDEYRRTLADAYKDNQETGKTSEYFRMGGDKVVLHGGQWAVTRLMCGTLAFDGPADPLPAGVHLGYHVAVGWIAIDLRTGRSVYLAPPRSRQLPKDVELGRVGFYDLLCRWGAGSCAVGVNIANKERVRNATPDSILEGDYITRLRALSPRDQRWSLWRWHPTPLTDKVEKLL